MKKFLFLGAVLVNSLTHADPAQVGPEELIARFNKDPGVTLVKVTASWCGPCRAMDPIVHRLQGEFTDKVMFQKFPVEKLMEGNDSGVEALKKEYNLDIKCIPTFLFFKEGKLVKVLVGSRTEKELKDSLNTVLQTKTKELLSQEREDVPSAIQQQLAQQEAIKKGEFSKEQREQMEKMVREFSDLIEFLENPQKENLREELLSSELVQGARMAIKEINDVLHPSASNT